MVMVKQPTVSSEPLFRYAQLHYSTLTGSQRDSGSLTMVEFADIVGISRRTLTIAARAGSITLWAADRLAVAMGAHPIEVWGDEWVTVNDRLNMERGVGNA